MKQTDKLIQSKLKEAEYDVPETLWADIERRLPAESRHIPLRQRAFVRYAAATVALLIGSVATYLFLSPSADPIVARQETEFLSAPEETAETQLPPSNDTPAIYPEAPISAPLAENRGNKQDAPLYLAEESAGTETATAPKRSENEAETKREPATKNKSTDTTPQRPPKAASATTYADARPVVRKQENKGIALGAVMENSFASSEYAPDTRHTRSQIYSIAIDQPLKYKHKIPISAGLTVEKQFGKHWGIETGIIYTLLRSDYQSGDYIREGRQELHYIGIPLSARYRFFNRKHFNLYVSAGPRMDFNIYGRRTDKSENRAFNATIANPAEENFHTETYTENVRDKHIQWSVHLKLGASYVITKHFGLYAEPAVSYFINNGNTDIANLWKDHPVTFSFHIGFRTAF